MIRVEPGDFSDTETLGNSAGGTPRSEGRFQSPTHYPTDPLTPEKKAKILGNKTPESGGRRVVRQQLPTTAKENVSPTWNSRGRFPPRMRGSFSLPNSPQFGYRPMGRPAGGYRNPHTSRRVEVNQVMGNGYYPVGFAACLACLLHLVESSVRVLAYALYVEICFGNLFSKARIL